MNRFALGIWLLSWRWDVLYFIDKSVEYGVSSWSTKETIICLTF